MKYTILKDNKLVVVSLEEDDNKNIIAIKSLETLKKEPYHEKAVKDEIYKLKWVDHSRSFSENPKHFCFSRTQSPWLDDSGLGNGHGVYLTKGDAIADMLKDGYTVFNDYMEIKAS